MADTGYIAIEFFRACAVLAATDASARIYMNQSPQNASYPHVVMSIISREESPTQDSGSAVDTLRIQVDCYAKPSTTESGFRIASRLSDDIRVAASRATNESDYDQIIDGIQEANYLTDYIEDIDLYRVTNDYMVRVKPETSVHSIISSGTYTPTATEVTLIDIITAYEAQYMRVGSTVTVSGNLLLTLDSGNTEGVFRLSLPINSTVADTTDLAGSAVCTSGGDTYVAQIKGGTANNATFEVNWGGGSALVYSYSYTYQII